MQNPVETEIEAKRRYSRESQRAWRAANREKALATKRAWAAKNADKILEQERARRANPISAALIAKNHRRFAATERSKEWRRNYLSDYYKQHPEKLRAYNKANRTKNHATHIACVKARSLRKRNAVPSWADMAAIRSLYETARRMTVETGIKHHVDHIIPLSGKTVCGLHVQGNLRVIEGAENMRKHNAFFEELVS